MDIIIQVDISKVLTITLMQAWNDLLAKCLHFNYRLYVMCKYIYMVCECEELIKKHAFATHNIKITVNSLFYANI